MAVNEQFHDYAQRARKTDPSTSHAAAERAEYFAGTHVSRILWALKTASLHAFDNEVGFTAEQISRWTGLTVVQIDRRLPEMRDAGLVRLAMHPGGGVWERNGFRVWEAV